MPRRRRLPPDTRLDWRDPNMPVVRYYRMSDGSTKTYADPDYERRYREYLITTSARPHYTCDPTYHMRKPK